jgi:hypothetical protein
MQRAPKAVPFLIAIIALNFTIEFGTEAWRIFASPIGGLEQATFASLVYGMGKLADLSPSGHVMLGMTFGFVDLAIATIFALHLYSRLQALAGGRIAHDLLDAGLVLIVAATIVAATPAILHGATNILIHDRLPLWLVGLAATLSMVERLPESNPARPGFCERMLMRRRKTSAIVVSPVQRGVAAALRWKELRREAGMRLESAPLKSRDTWFVLH